MFLANVHDFGLSFVPFVRANPRSLILLSIFIINLYSSPSSFIFQYPESEVELRQGICNGLGQDLKGETGIAKDH